MKTEIKLAGVTAIAGVPKNLQATSGRLVLNKDYKVLRFVKVPAQKDKAGKTTFREWNGVLIERLDTGTQLVIGTNTLLGQSICFVGVGTEGASAKGYKNYSVEGNCFTSPNDFSSKADDSDNGTVFKVEEIVQLPVNREFLGDTEITSDNLQKFTATKDKDFYRMEIVKESV